MPFGPSGERLAVTPVAPVSAPDVANLPWRRLPAQAWTTEEFRAVVLAWLSTYAKAHATPQWKVEEIRFGIRGGEYMQPVLRVSFLQGDVWRQASAFFPESSQVPGTPLSRTLALLRVSLEAQ
jgi:hypothetical protein